MGPTTRKRKTADAGTKMSRTDIKRKIRELKKERAVAGGRAAKSKVEEFNAQLRVYRRRLRRAARHK